MKKVWLAPTHQSNSLNILPIRYTANKEGVAHLELKKPRALEQMKLMTIADERGRHSDSQEISHAIRAIARWTLNAIGYVLDKRCGL
jgi:hypothetical protein